MRKKTIIVIFSLVTSLFLITLCVEAESGKISAKQAKKKLTAQLIIDKIQEEIKSLEVINEKQLYERMKDNPGNQFTDPGNSWETLQKETKSTLSKRYETEVSSVLKQLDSDKPKNIPSWFSEKEREQFSTIPEQAIRENLSNNFGAKHDPNQDNNFNKARKKACQDQWDKFSFDVHPTEKEVEETSQMELSERLKEKLIKKQKLSLFEENKKAIGGPEVVGQIIDDAIEQLNEQREILNDSTGGREVVPEDIESHIEDEIEQYRTALAKKKRDEKERIKTKIYKVFPSVEKEFSNKGSVLSVEKFKKTISESTYTVDEEYTKSLIKGSIKDHTNKEKSKKICIDKHRTSIEKALIDKQVKQAPKEKQEEFRKLLEGIVKNSYFKKEVDRITTQAINEGFNKIREELANEQFKEIFGPLHKGIWKLKMEQIEKYERDPLIVISDPLAMPGISSKTFDAEELLDETHSKIYQAERSSIAEGLGALGQQREIVNEVEMILRRMVENLSSEQQTKDEFFRITKIKWNLKQLAQKYVSIFPSIEKLIKDKSAAIWRTERVRRSELLKEQIERQRIIREAEEKRFREEIQKRNAEIQAAKEKAAKEAAEKAAAGNDKGESGGSKEKAGGEETNQKGGEKGDGKTPGQSGAGKGKGKGDGSGIGVGPLFEPDLILDFDYDNGKIDVKMMFPKKGKSVDYSLTIDDLTNPESFATRMVRIQEFYELWLKDRIIRKEIGKQTVSIYIIARIFDGRVPYGAINIFRKCIGAAMNNVDPKERVLEIYWFDDFFRKEHKHKPTVPPDIKSKARSLMA